MGMLNANSLSAALVSFLIGAPLGFSHRDLVSQITAPPTPLSQLTFPAHIPSSKHILIILLNRRVYMLLPLTEIGVVKG